MIASSKSLNIYALHKKKIIISKLRQLFFMKCTLRVRNRSQVTAFFNLFPPPPLWLRLSAFEINLLTHCTFYSSIIPSNRLLCFFYYERRCTMSFFSKLTSVFPSPPLSPLKGKLWVSWPQDSPSTPLPSA